MTGNVFVVGAAHPRGLVPRRRGGYNVCPMTDAVTNTGADGGGGVAKPVALYPAEVHLRIVVAGDFDNEAALQAALAAHAVVAPLAPASRSRTGRFRTLQVSVCVQGLSELEELDRALRAVSGVRMLL